MMQMKSICLREAADEKRRNLAKPGFSSMDSCLVKSTETDVFPTKPISHFAVRREISKGIMHILLSCTPLPVYLPLCEGQ